MQRVKKELVECEKDASLTGIKVTLLDKASFSHLQGTILGPTESPYEGGTFDVDIKIPGSYPFEPPKMKFITKVWHPNISSQTGAICLDILKDQWSPAFTLKTALLSVQALLTAAEPDDPQDGVVANQYKSDYEEFCKTAQFWTETYAMKSSGSGAKKGGIVEEHLRLLTSMGFTDHALNVKALQKSNGNVDQAIEVLLS